MSKVNPKKKELPLKMATNGYEDPNFIGFPKNHKRLVNRIVPNTDRKNKI